MHVGKNPLPLRRTIIIVSYCRPVIVEQWSLSTNGQAAGSLLMELSSLGMTIGELVTYLKELKLDTYSLGLAPYGMLKFSM